MGYKHGTPAERFWRHVTTDGPIPAHRPDLGPCWEWTASRNHLGYGQFRAGEMTGAHRWSYTAANGPIPEGLDIDHLCRVRHCVNPAHLEAVTHRENMLRGNTPNARALTQTHCVNGHEYTDANTYIDPTHGRRSCRACLGPRVALHGLRRRVKALEEENAALRAEVARLRDSA